MCWCSLYVCLSFSYVFECCMLSLLLACWKIHVRLLAAVFWWQCLRFRSISCVKVKSVRESTEVLALLCKPTPHLWLSLRKFKGGWSSIWFGHSCNGVLIFDPCNICCWPVGGVVIVLACSSWHCVRRVVCLRYWPCAAVENGVIAPHWNSLRSSRVDFEGVWQLCWICIFIFCLFCYVFVVYHRCANNVEVFDSHVQATFDGCKCVCENAWCLTWMKMYIPLIRYTFVVFAVAMIRLLSRHIWLAQKKNEFYHKGSFSP